MIKVRTKKEKVIAILDDDMIKHMNGWEANKISRKLIGIKKVS